MIVNIHLKSKEIIKVEDFVSATERAPMVTEKYTADNVSELLVQSHAHYVFESTTKIFSVDGNDVLYFEFVKG